MRKVECPWPDFFGGLDGGPVRHQIFDDHKSDECQYAGPFSSESALVAFLVGNYRALISRTDRPEFKALYYERHLARVLHGNWPILTHGDVQQENILVVENTDHSEPARGRSFDIVLIDWEASGWLPDYWEFFYACWPPTERWMNDWFSRLEEVLPVFPAQAAMMEQLDNDICCPYW
ncbi:hypothetical protein N7466_000280 [Penicillium verhagenii]|uniref:uncharacterized protein n=1 Tax=Penicillium verhagenii TaxID=1562060 RepID=UPI002544DF04|nr:uncharacterized protein N7466_000280 [Penicillium verhagenii]KAJ5947265.1 hypothetical protein N7466_000280 [Penicillium verhagenii]